MKRFGLVAIALLLQCPALFAQTVSVADLARRERTRLKEIGDRRATLVNYLVENSGARSTMEAVANSFMGKDMQLEQLPPETREALVGIGRDVFRPENLMPVFEQRFSSEMDDKTIEDVYRWYQTPLGMKVLEIEKANAGKTIAPGASVSAPRMQLIAQLEAETNSTEQSVTTLVKMTKEMLGRMLSWSGVPINRDAFLQGFEQGLRREAPDRLRPMILSGYATLYEPLSDAELDQYVQFLNTYSGDRFVRATWLAIQDTMAQGGRETGSRVGEALRTGTMKGGNGAN